VKVTIDKAKKILTIEMPLEEPTPSTSGKTMVIASSRGNQTSNAQYDGRAVTIGVNAYYKR
jgi:hypothetical protein